MYKDKYIKYREKYLNLKRIEKLLNEQDGGKNDVFKIDNIKTNIPVECTLCHKTFNSNSLLTSHKCENILYGGKEDIFTLDNIHGLDELKNTIDSISSVENTVDLNNKIDTIKKEEVKKDNYNKVKHIIKQPGYKNRFIYKNNIDNGFINNLNIEKVLNTKSNTISYYKVNNNDGILNKIKNNTKYFKNNSELRVLNYSNDEVLFEVYN